MMGFLKMRALKAVGLSIFGIVSSFALDAQAADWQKVLDCDGGAAVLDIRERRSVELVDYQLVIRNHDIINYLYREGLETLSASGEVIIPFTVYREQEILVRYAFNPRLQTSVIETVRRFDGGRKLSFDIYRAESPSAGHWLQKDRIGGWTFQNCARNGY